MKEEEIEITAEDEAKLSASFLQDPKRMQYAREVSTSEALRKRAIAASNGHHKT
jgi:hypothetical protein